MKAAARNRFMTNNVISRRVLEAAGLFLIGDGLIGLVRPRRHSWLWHFGPQLTRAITEELAANPKAARVVYAAELAVGVALCCAQTDRRF